MATYYIAPTTHPTTPGNDTTGNGSSATPWATISKAHTSATAGDTIICKDGTYTWSSQTFSKSLTIQAQNSGLAILDGAAGNFNWTFGAITISFSGIVFQNLERLGQNNNVFTSGSSNAIVSFSRCVFRSITFNATSSGNARLFEIGSNSPACAWTFLSCLFNDPRRITAPYISLFQAAHNTVHDTCSLTLRGCVVYLATAIDIILKGEGGNRLTLNLKNNIFSNFTGATVAIRDGGSYTETISNNCYFNLTPLTDAAAVTSDPLFVDAAGDNFNLRPTSPCLNTGTLV